MMNIEIDPNSGFCFGVVNAIRKAEEELGDKPGAPLYCLGDIVHNSDEVQRLATKGLRIITHADIPTLQGVKLLLRAHGEPPSTYEMARNLGIEIIDATCPVVLRLQQRIKECYQQDAPQGMRPQIVIYGKHGHAEVNGLVGQTAGEAIVIDSVDNIGILDFNRPIALYSQTTKSVEGFFEVIEAIRKRMAPGVEFRYYDTICRQVASRVEKLRAFARTHDVVIFVAGKKSSNGKVLFHNCLQENARTHLISNPSELQPEWFSADATLSVGICGATSTPRWLMEQVKSAIELLQ